MPGGGDQSHVDLDIQRHSVIVNPSQLHDGAGQSRDTSPAPSLSLLPSLPVSTSSITQSVSTLSSFDSYLESSSHPRLSDPPSSKLCLKEEPEVTATKVEQLFLSSEFGVSAPASLSRPVTSSAIPNFLHFTPDESVTQSLLSGAGCTKQESPLSSSAESEILGLVQDPQEPAT